jgi:hypothetical protein
VYGQDIFIENIKYADQARTYNKVNFPVRSLPLAMKVPCFYLREDDENGHKRKERAISPIFDFSTIRCFEDRSL